MKSQSIIIGQQTFEDLPGLSAEPFLNGFIINKHGQFGDTVGFYNPGIKTVDIKVEPRQLHECDDLHQAMRLTFLLLKKGKLNPELAVEIPAGECEESEKDFTIDDKGVIHFKDMIGWTAEVIPNGEVLTAGYYIFNEQFKNVAQCIDKQYSSGKTLMINTEMRGIESEFHEFPDLLQAVRYVYLMTRKGKIQPPSSDL